MDHLGYSDGALAPGTCTERHLGDPSRRDYGEIVEVDVKQLHVAESPRQDGIVVEHVRLLAESVAELPPILVHQQTMQVIDGMHRLLAAKLKKQAQIAVRFFDGSREEAFILGVKANTTHGLPLSLVDRKSAATRILADNPNLSDRVISADTGLSPKTVAALRRRSTTSMRASHVRTGKDGRSHPIDASEGRSLAAQLMNTEPGASLRSIAKRAGISTATAIDVRRRLNSGRSATTTRKREGDDHPQRDGHLDSGESQTSPRDILRHLRSDPSLRYTEFGRSLISWLEVHILESQELPDELEKLPPHCVGPISDLAQACSAIWKELSAMLAGQEIKQQDA